MKKISEFMVSKRYWILGIMLCLAIVCAFLSQSVAVNYDMSKYLPDDSSMKKGMNIMTEDFPDMGSSNTIRVMAEGLDEAKKTELLEKLKAIPNVESVAHDDSEDYNKEDYSLYVISTEYAYNSPEESAIEDTLAEDFGAYNIIFQNDNTGTNGISTWILIVAMVILLTILFIMCESWLEPILFLVTIGFAVMINAGTNIFLGEISSITSSISAILQLVLSMDYSIILLNRYRQEKELGLSNNKAMEAALRHSFISVTSSAMTTVVGLLALVFMNFKIGVDLGVVLAKGVFISLVCVLTVLPALILLFDKLIAKTAKKSPHISMGAVARFSHKFRYVLSGLFVVLFIGAYLLQGNTQTVYTIAKEDPIADIFPTENMLVLVYNNDDEDKAAELADSFEEKDGVKQVMGYPNLLGKLYTAEEFGDTINSLGNSMGVEIGSDVDLDPALLKLIYYHYYDGATSSVTMEEFLTFLSDNVLNNDTFSDAIDEDMREQADRLADFSDADNLTSRKSIAELAGFFDMDEETVKDLLLYYYTQYGGVDTGTMTLPDFVNFLQTDVVNDPDFSSFLDKNTKEQINTLSQFTDKAALQKKHTSAELAQMLDMDEAMVKLLFTLHNAQDVSGKKMTLARFTAFLNDNILKNATFADSFDKSTKAQLQSMNSMVQLAASGKTFTSAQMAGVLGMDEATMTQLYFLYLSTKDAAFQQEMASMTMTLEEFVALAKSQATDEQLTQLSQMEQIIKVSVSEETLSAAQLAGITGMNEASVTAMFAVQSQAAGKEVTAMTLQEFLTQALSMQPDNAQLQQLSQIVNLAASGNKIDAATLAQIFGMETTQVRQLFGLTLAAQKSISLPFFTNFLVNTVLTNEAYAGNFSKAQKTQLTTLNQMVQLAASGKGLDTADLSQTFGMDESLITMIFRLYYGGNITGKTMSIKEMVNFILTDPVMSGFVDGETIAQLKTMQGMIKATINNTAYTYSQLASTLGMDNNQLKQLYLLYISRYGDTSSWQMSVQQLVNYLNSDVLTNENFADLLDEDSKKMLTGAKTMIDAVVSGKEYSVAETQNILSALTEKLDANTVELLYFYYAAENNYNSAWALSVDQLFNHLHDSVLNDARFSAFIDDEMKSSIEDMIDTLNDGIKMMKTEEYSRMIIYTTIPVESSDTTVFMDELTAACDSFENECYLVGNSAMSYEMQQTFDREMLLITLLTALAIFIIVLISFRSFVIPTLLVLIVQCGVYITVSIMGLQGYSIYFLALLIVECILMGATIDYGILFTNYYRDNRGKLSVLDALKAAYSGSIHTIMTSGLIIVLVTGIVGYTHSDPTIAQICRTIATGALSAILLILFVLPGLLALFDKYIVHKKNSVE